MARKSVGRRPVRSRDVSIFNFDDDFGNFDDTLVEDIEGRPKRKKAKAKQKGRKVARDFPDPARTTRDLTTVAIALPLTGVATSLVGTL